MRSCSPDEWEREDGWPQLVEAGKRGWVGVQNHGLCFQKTARDGTQRTDFSALFKI